MSHELEFDENGARFVYSTKLGAPWHNLGSPIDEPMDIPAALRFARLADWNLVKRPLYVRDETRTSFRKVEQAVSVYRPGDGSTLGVVGTDYEIFSNEETFLGLGGALGQLGLPVITAGSIRKGSRTFMCFEHPEAAKLPNGDEVKGHLLISTSHDGSLALQASDVEIVVVCSNTLSMALGGAASIFRIKHTRNMRDSIAEASRLLRKAEESRTAKLAAAEQLLGIKISRTEWTAFLETLIPVPVSEDPEHDRKVSGALRLRDTLDTIYLTHPTQANKIDTAWGAYNAVTFYTSHLQTRRKTDSASAEENRMEALTGGRDDELSARALKLLVPAS
jgi:phage/plasmid-like protein (TIGR03299 family)